VATPARPRFELCALFHFVAKTNRALLWLNNLFLMTVAFLPFHAGLLGEYPSSQVSIVLYGCTLIAANTSATLTWIYASRASLLHPGIPTAFRRFAAQLTSVRLSASRHLPSNVFEALPHVDLGAALLEPNFVHQCSHEVNTSATAALDILGCSGIGNVSGIKPLSFVSDNNGHAASMRRSPWKRRCASFGRRATKEQRCPI
jgi:hypothetical protein